MGKPPTICHQHLRDSSTSQWIAHVGRDRHFTAAPCHRASSIISGRHRSTLRCLPSPGKLNLFHGVLLHGAGWRGPGQPQLLPPAAGGRWSRAGMGRRVQGSARVLCPSRQRRIPARFLGCSGLLPSAASGSFPGEALEPGSPPGRSWPCLARRLRWEMAGGAGRTASSLRRGISCHPLPDPELWLRPGGSERSR